MTKDQRTRLELRLVEIEWELQDIADLRVVGDDEGDPAAAEDALLGQQEEIEYRLGIDWFEQRDAN